jgi:hypothetical protein
MFPLQLTLPLTWPHYTHNTKNKVDWNFIYECRSFQNLVFETMSMTSHWILRHRKSFFKKEDKYYTHSCVCTKTLHHMKTSNKILALLLRQFIYIEWNLYPSFLKGPRKINDECKKVIYLYAQCTETRKSERYLRDNNACGNDG